MTPRSSPLDRGQPPESHQQPFGEPGWPPPHARTRFGGRNNWDFPQRGRASRHSCFGVRLSVRGLSFPFLRFWPSSVPKCQASSKVKEGQRPLTSMQSKEETCPFPRNRSPGSTAGRGPVNAARPTPAAPGRPPRPSPRFHVLRQVHGFVHA